MEHDRLYNFGSTEELVCYDVGSQYTAPEIVCKVATLILKSPKQCRRDLTCINSLQYLDDVDNAFVSEPTTHYQDSKRATFKLDVSRNTLLKTRYLSY